MHQSPHALPVDRWYGLEVWRQRSKAQLRRHPLCVQCEKDGKVVAATIADHEPPHKGNWNAFRLGPLQSLCLDCHNRKDAIVRRGYRTHLIGDDGLPLDPKHPFNRARPQ